MVHRRKNAHPVCKTRRHLEREAWNELDIAHPHPQLDVTEAEEGTLLEEEPEYEYEIPDSLPEPGYQPSPSPSPQPDSEGQATSDSPSRTEPQPIMIPDDLFKDFEAVRTKTNMDATDLMRRLLRDYQSLSASSLDEVGQPGPGNSGANPLPTEKHSDTVHNASSDHTMGLDLSLKPTKLHGSNRERISTPQVPDQCTMEVPLDLSLAHRAAEISPADLKQVVPSEKDKLINESQNSIISTVPVNLLQVPPGEACMYVYPVCYAGSDLSGMMSSAGLGGVIVPEPTEDNTKKTSIGSPGLDKLASQNLSSESKVDMNSIALPSYGSSLNFPDTIRQQLDNTFPQEVKKELPKYFRMSSAKQKHSPGDKVQPASKYHKHKEEKEMKIISENTSYPGVYTSVLKLPWSRRTRTKKASKKNQQETQEKQTEQQDHQLQHQQDQQPPQQQYQHQQYQQQHPSSLSLPVSEGSSLVPGQAVPPNVILPFPHLEAFSQGSVIPQLNGQQGVSSDPSLSQSVMMVYPNSTLSSLGKPVRKRGRPPKLPMLAKLLQQSNKKPKRVKTADADTMLQSQIANQGDANSGLVLYSAAGQVLSAFSGFPLQQIAVSAEHAQIHGQHSLGPQAQFLGEFQLPAQFASSQIQFTSQHQPDIQSVPAQRQFTQISEMNLQGACQEGMYTKCDQQTDVTTTQTCIPPTVQSGFHPTSPVNTREEEGSVSISNAGNKDQSSTDDGATGTHILPHTDTNTISTMSTKSISSTGGGAIYQEMILSSKSLVDIKPRRRQTAIQLLKSKSSNQNFICTSFRIRPRLVAQAQAQRERLAAKCMKNLLNGEGKDFDPKYSDLSPEEARKYSDNLRETIDMADIELKLGKVSKRGKRKRVPPLKIKIKHENVDEGDNSVLNPTIIAPIDIKKEVTEQSDFVQNRAESNDVGPDGKFASDSSSKQALFAETVTAANPPYTEMETGNDNLSSDSPLTRDSLIGSPSIDHLLEEGMSQDMFQALFHCKICNEIVPVDDKLEHWRKHLQTQYMCKTCSPEGSDVTGLTEKDDAEQDGTSKCETCRDGELEIEMSGVPSTLSSEKVACEECGKQFRSIRMLVDHQLQVHKTTSQLSAGATCEVCGKFFQNYKSMVLHRKSQHEEMNEFSPEEYNKRYHSGTESHVFTPISDKKQYYHCIYDDCSKRFLKNFHLQEHIRVKHFNIKAFPCPWPGCEKEFAAERHMKVHLLIHRDEKPLRCQYCDYRCRQRSAMNWHMRKHPEAPYRYKRNGNSPTMTAQESE